jgi:hypothetical protein
MDRSIESDDYFFVKFKNFHKNSFFHTDGHLPTYAFDLLMELYRLLKIEYEEEVYNKERGFWCNRDLILGNLNQLTIVANKKSNNDVVVGFYLMRNEIDDEDDHEEEDDDESNVVRKIIWIMETFPKNVGYGRMIIQKEQNGLQEHQRLCCENPLDESRGFFQKMNVGEPYELPENQQIINPNKSLFIQNEVDEVLDSLEKQGIKLTKNGNGNGNDDPVSVIEINRIARDLPQIFIHSATASVLSSYGLKHVMENARKKWKSERHGFLPFENTYVSNGDFIVAAILSGVKYHFHSKHDVNCKLYVHQINQ